MRSLFPMGSSNLRPVQSSPVIWNFPLPDLHPTSPVGVVSNYLMACLGGQPVCVKSMYTLRRQSPPMLVKKGEYVRTKSQDYDSNV